jgi:DNA-binding beta-propeller fold protein YncE
MKNTSLRLTILSTFLAFAVPLSVWADDIKSKAPNYHAAGEIPIKGQGGWDALAIDPDAHRLFVSHADRVVVIDTLKNQVIKEILDTPGVHCIAIAPDLKKAFSSNGKEGKVSVISLETLATKTKIKVGEKPDAIIYAPESQEVYAFNGNGNSVSVIDGKKEREIATLPLPGKPEFAIGDPATHQIFVNIEDKNSVAVLDTKTHRVVNVWKLDGCESPTGIALDAKNHRVFSVCENQKMVMIDAITGKTITSVPTGEGTDGADFDPETNLAFSSNGKTGTVTVIKEETPTKLSLVQNIKTSTGARTMVLNPKDHRIYLPTAKFQGAEKGARPKPIDGTQTVLVFEP